MDEPAASNGGLFASIRRTISSGLGLAQTRLELFTLELQEEKWRAVDLVLRAALIIVLGLLALGLITTAVVYLLWHWSPLGALLGLALLYGAAAAMILLSIRHRLRSGPKPFAGTLAELRKDRECLSGKSSRK